MNPLSTRLQQAERVLGLKKKALAKELRITPEWYSKILNNKVDGSADIGLRLDDLLRRRGIEPTSITGDSAGDPAVREEQAPYPADSTADISELDSKQAAPELQRRIRAHMDGLLRSAGTNVQRLGWIAEQQRQHLSEPMSWGMKERLLHEMIDRQQKGKAAAGAQPQSRQGGTVG